ncbi:unnamed protein product [Prunus armeniaca]
MMFRGITRVETEGRGERYILNSKSVAGGYDSLKERVIRIEKYLGALVSDDAVSVAVHMENAFLAEI